MDTLSTDGKSHLLPYARRADFKVGRASELQGRDRIFYRFLEILPGAASWATLVGMVLASIYIPFVTAYFIIAFSVYWLLKTAFLSYHLRYNWKRMKHHLSLDWAALIARFEYGHLYHVVILPFYKEPEEIINSSLASLAASRYDLKSIIIVLAQEERAGVHAQNVARRMKEKWGETFGFFLVTTHPQDVPGEMAGKGSNASWAAEQVRTQVLDPHGIRYNHTLVSIFDIDTVVYPDYFNCLVWHFMTAPRPLKSSFQPIPLFNNNIWSAPSLSRVVAMSSTFWEMIQQERAERMATFSSHAVSFQALYEVGYWQNNMVSEDSRIFWNLMIANNGEYDVVPLSYPVCMDANVISETPPSVQYMESRRPRFTRIVVLNQLFNFVYGTIKLFLTGVNIYKQHRRWTYGVENFVYTAYHFTKNKAISRKKRIVVILRQAEGYWSLVTNPIMLFILGLTPIFFGGRVFHETVLSYNLPLLVRNVLSVAMLGLVVSAIISLSLLPPRPLGRSKWGYVPMFLQWILVPFTMIFFSALPGLDAQTRLMLGKYMGFWVTPKSRSTDAENAPNGTI
ncbi:glycosyltransferase family 2 protein [Patescibacteria group bacterium]|nr:glycosyltransferase family 2 protein [Patescibacteria group bacterium]